MYVSYVQFKMLSPLGRVIADRTSELGLNATFVLDVSPECTVLSVGLGALSALILACKHVERMGRCNVNNMVYGPEKNHVGGFLESRKRQSLIDRIFGLRKLWKEPKIGNKREMLV